MLQTSNQAPINDIRVEKFLSTIRLIILIHYVLILSGLSTFLSAQNEFGWYVYKDDSLKVEVFHEGFQLKTVGTYPNKQKKYIRYSEQGQIVDTVSYYSDNGDMDSKVCYENLSYELIDSSHLENYTFIDSCYTIAHRQIAQSFSQSNTTSLFKLDHSNSKQYSPQFSRNRIVVTKLYEPVGYKLKECSFLFHSVPDSTQMPYPRFLFHFRFDSTMKIVQSELDLKKSYSLNYDINYARKIMAKYNFKNLKRNGTPKAIKIIGPYLKVRQKQIYWIVQRRAGRFYYSESFDHFIDDDYSEELEINVETGAYKKVLKFTGIQ